MKIKFKNIRKGQEDLHADDDLTNEDFIDEQSSEQQNQEIETYYTEPNGTTFTYDPNTHTFSVNDVTTGMSTEFAVPPFIVEKPEVIEYGDAAIDFSSLSNEEQYMINQLLRQKNFVHYDFYKRLSALKSSMTEEQFKQYEDANKYLSIDDYGVLDLSNEPYSVQIAVLDSLKEAGYKLEEREEPIVKTKENPHNLSQREIDWAYAEQNFPAAVTYPDKYHDLSVTNDYYNLNPHKSTMTQSDYDKTKAVEDAMFNTTMDLATLLIPLKIGGFKGMWKGLKFIGKSFLDPGSFVDWVGKTTKYATPLARSWFGASTIPGIATNFGMSGYFGYDAYKGLRENGLNWQTGLEMGFAALPFVAEGASFVAKGLKDIRSAKTKYLNFDAYDRLIKRYEKKANKQLQYRTVEDIRNAIIKYSDPSNEDVKLILEKLEEFEKLQQQWDEVIKIKKSLSHSQQLDELDKIDKELRKTVKEFNESVRKLANDSNADFFNLFKLLDGDNIISEYKDLNELESVMRAQGMLSDNQKLIIVREKLCILENSQLKPFTLVQGEKIPILDASGKQIGELPVITHLESGKAIISDGYIETTTNNIKALQAKFPGAKPFGSSVMVSDLQVPHFTHDYDFIITEKDAAKIAGLDKVQFNSNGFTKTIGIDANGNIVPAGHGVFNVDLNIIRSGPNGKVINNSLTEELFRHQYPELNSELTAQSFIKDSTKHAVDIPMTPKELLDGYDPVVNTFLDSHEIDFVSKPKHIHRILGYIIYNKNPKKIEECITQLARAQGLTGDWRAPRSIFSNVEENKQVLKSIGFSEEDVANIATNPEVMQNLFDYWTLDKIVRRRGVYNNPSRTKIDFNDPKLSKEKKREMLLNSFREWMSIGGNANGPGLNTVHGTSGVVGSGTGGGGMSFDIFGTFSLKPDLSECKTLTEAVDKILYTVGAEEYGGAFPEILQGMTPMQFLRNNGNMTPSDWKPVSKELLDAGVQALTYPTTTNYMSRAGEYSSVVDDPNRNPIFSYLQSLIYPLSKRIEQQQNYTDIGAIETPSSLQIFIPWNYGSIKDLTSLGKKGTNELLKVRQLAEQMKNLQLKKDIYREEKNWNIESILNNFIRKIASNAEWVTKQSQKYKDEIQSIKDKLDKVYRIRKKAANINSNIQYITNLATFLSEATAIIVVIGIVLSHIQQKNEDEQLVRYYLNEIDKFAGALETVTDEKEIRTLEKEINYMGKQLNDFLEKNPKLYKTVEKYVKDNLETKETPQNKQGGKLIPRNKFLSIYSQI